MFASTLLAEIIALWSRSIVRVAAALRRRCLCDVTCQRAQEGEKV